MLRIWLKLMGAAKFVFVQMPLAINTRTIPTIARIIICCQMVGNSGTGSPRLVNIHPTITGTAESQSPKVEAAVAKIVRISVRICECSCHGGKRIGRKISMAINKTKPIPIASPNYQLNNLQLIQSKVVIEQK